MIKRFIAYLIFANDLRWFWLWFLKSENFRQLTHIATDSFLWKIWISCESTQKVAHWNILICSPLKLVSFSFENEEKTILSKVLVYYIVFCHFVWTNDQHKRNKTCACMCVCVCGSNFKMIRRNKYHITGQY